MPTLEIAELFRSIQGESTWAGLPCAFIRLAGCNLRCAYCDTAYAYGPGRRMELDEIVRQCAVLACPLVEITGGEPLLQEATPSLAQRLNDAGHTVLVETNGTLPIEALPRNTIRIMDIKCPGSGMADRMRWENIERLAAQDEVKFVVGSRVDYEWSRDVLRRYDLSGRCRAVLFSAAFGLLEPKTLAGWILEDGLPVRLQLQLHKYIWDPDTRGV
ncbi:MAG TPA: radical SAM protein [Candidatus Hydrogenedentes bacterium]|nr:radical SAM protein [Candidatus Hydrogenedentota bacterium]HOV72555.1 radical SAM protein [Candidatus Hydrogenedentota bacterium]HPC15282.1 radical SAM protein [Candidatus Hydrogenedentota bacterium]HRT19237.1 radical SAM protein [Candidatus Hydrogenedentota bacterium]HRT63317.1 radical SAM protein [Candidatus Hydrogenedentota bacterium]